MREYQQKVPPKVRDVVYWTTFAVSAMAALVTGLAPIWMVDAAPQIIATAGVATTVMGVIGGGLGVVYRPGKQAQDAEAATHAARADAVPAAAVPAA